MKQLWTELVFILDRSGSMRGLEHQTMSGFNEVLFKQKALEGEAVVYTVLFDDQYELLHHRVPIQEIKSLTKEDYYVRGMTALLDAVGKTIQKVKEAHLNKDFTKPDKVLFVIITDGMENASMEYSYKAIESLISETKSNGWEYMFLGANLDAAKVGARMGIHKDRTVRYHADQKGTKINYEVINEAVTSFRIKNHLSKAWKKRIDEDFKSRK